MLKRFNKKDLAAFGLALVVFLLTIPAYCAPDETVLACAVLSGLCAVTILILTVSRTALAYGLACYGFCFAAVLLTPDLEPRHLYADAMMYDTAFFSVATITISEFLPYKTLRYLFGFAVSILLLFELANGEYAQHIRLGHLYVMTSVDWQEIHEYFGGNSAERLYKLFGVSAALVVMAIIVARMPRRRLDLYRFTTLFITCCLLAAACPLTETGKSRAHLMGAIPKALYESTAYAHVTAARKDKVADIGATLNDGGTPNTLLVVIGESANRNHWHKYGYIRPTTPYIDALGDQEALFFTNAISSYCATVLSLQRALTLASIDSGRKYIDDGMYSIVEMARGAGYKTAWISNQAQKGAWGYWMADLGASADSNMFVSGSHMMDENANPPDEIMLEPVKKALDTAGNTPTMIFVHLMGSHDFYQLRYPEGFGHFDGDQKFPVDVNGYDTSILYTDEMLHKLIELLKTRPGPASLVYFSDHGESPYLGTSHDPGQFSIGHIEVPLMLWTSDAYRTRYPQIVQTARQNLDKPFMLDRLTPTLLTWAHIEAPFLDPANSLLDPAFTPHVPRLTMEGDVDYEALPQSYCEVTKAATGINPREPCLPKK